MIHYSIDHGYFTVFILFIHLFCLYDLENKLFYNIEISWINKIIFYLFIQKNLNN